MNSELGEGAEENDVEVGAAGTAAGSEDSAAAARKRRKPVPLPPAGKGILISPGFRYVGVIHF